MAIFLVAGAIYYLNSGLKPDMKSVETSALNPDGSSASPSPSVTASATPSSVPSSSASGSALGALEDLSKRSATELAPDQQTLRKEAEEDPERVPRSTLFFAARLGKKMEVALKSEEGAANLFQELQDCVTSQRLEGSVTSQTLCLQDAQKLSLAYPQRLKEQYATLFERAEPRVRSLLVPIRH